MGGGLHLKIIIKALICIIIAFSCVSCRRTYAPNERRGTDYTYDFVDFIDITLYGEDGSGMLEISPVDIGLHDFDTEDEYIRVKKDLSLINAHLIQGQSLDSKIKVSRSTGLSNGDVVKITVGLKKNELCSDMNIEPYEYVIDGLHDLERIDLFAEDFVSFYATEDGSLYAHIKDPKRYPEELTDNLRYRISVTDGVEPGRSVLSITVGMNEQYLKDSGYGTMDVFMIKHGFAAETTNDRVLEKMVYPIDFSASSSIAVERALYKALYAYEGDALVKICNLQQTPRQKISEPYCYMVVFSVDEDGTLRYFRRQIKMVYVDGEYVVIDSSDRESTAEKYVYEPFTESNMIMNFTMETWNDPEEQETEPAPAEQMTAELPETAGETQD